MRILTLTNEFEEESFGGAGTAATGMIYLFDRLGVQQTVIVPCSNGIAPEWERCGQQIKVLKLPRNVTYFGRLGLIKAEIVHRKFPELWRQWDWIHLQAINFTPLAYTLSGGQIPILYSVYSFLRRELADDPETELQAQFNIQEEAFMRCQKIHLISRSEKDYLSAHFPRYLGKTEVLPLGILWPEERWQPKSLAAFLYVGRLLDYKGIEDLLRAMAQVQVNDASGRQISLDIVGQGTEAYEASLKQLVKVLGLERRVQFHGWLESARVRQMMAQAMCLVVPSRREAWGLVALEGMAVGTPLIAARTGGLTEFVSEAWALTFAAGDVSALAAALQRAFANPEFLRSLAIKGRKRAWDLTWDQLAPKYWRLLKV